MPYLPYNDEEQKKKAEQNGQVNLSGSSTTINQSAQNVAPSTPKPVGRSGSWTNLDTYLNANKDNAETMGNTIASNITNAGSAVRTGLQDTQTDYNSMVDKGTLKDLDTAKAESENIVRQARVNNQDSQINDDQVNRFKEVSNATYAGPNSLDASQYFADTQTKFNKANDYQNNAKSDEGRFNLLQEMFSRPSYSQGQKSFDNLLIQGNQQAKTNIQGAADSLNDLQSSWDKANTDASDVAAERLAATNDARNYAQNSLSTNRSERTNEVDSSLADINNRWADQYNEYNNLLSNYGGGELALTKEQADKLALTGSGQGIFNVLKNAPATSFLDLQGFDANKVVDKNQFAQLSALDKLANQFGLASSSKFSDIDQAGTLGLNNNFDASRFGQAAKGAQTDFNDYSKGANFLGTGSNTQSYNYGPGGMFRDTVSRDAKFDVNLDQFLQQAGVADTGSGVFTNNFLVPGVLNDVIRNSLGSISDGRGDLWRDGSKEAERAAGQTAADIAKASLFAQIEEALNNQGFSNRIKIKE